MPAGSDPGTGDPNEVVLPRTWRPLGPRIAGIVAGGALLVVTVLLWIGFDDETRSAVTPFQRGTVLALFGLGFGCLHALVRSRVVASTDRLVVVNGYRRHEYAWPEIVAVRMPPGAPWVTLDLADGTSASAMGIQGSDGTRAVVAVRALRVLVDRANAPGD